MENTVKQTLKNWKDITGKPVKSGKRVNRKCKRGKGRKRKKGKWDKRVKKQHKPKTNG